MNATKRRVRLALDTLRRRIEELVRRRGSYDAARRRALSRLRTGYDLQWTPTRSRDELHER